MPRKGKVEKVMHEFKAGTLHSGSAKGPKVQSRKQAIAIALSEAREAGEEVAPPPRKKPQKRARRAKPFLLSPRNPKRAARG